MFADILCVLEKRCDVKPAKPNEKIVMKTQKKQTSVREELKRALSKEQNTTGCAVREK